LLGKKLYLDANVFIYALEALTPWKEAAQSVLRAVDSGACSAVTSELTLAECLTRPLQLGQSENAVVFEKALQSAGQLAVLPIRREILIEAARLRATSSLKLPDAIHAATAVRHGCALFVTNDQTFRRLQELQPVFLSELDVRQST
jgi:predicted nucleic acid-binding protein